MFNLNHGGLMASVSRVALMADTGGDGGISGSVDDLANFDFDAHDVAGLDDEPEVSDVAGTGEDAPDPAQAPDEAREGESEDGDNDEPEIPALDAPVMWTDEEKAIFADASPELQKTILEREAAKDSEITKNQMRAAELTKTNQVIGQIVEAIDGHLQTSKDLFAFKWDGITQEHWNDLAYKNPDEHKRLFGEYQSEMRAIADMKASRDEAAATAKSEWTKAEAEQLFTALPELRNPANMTPLIKFAIDEGVTPEELDSLGSKFWKLLNKAHLYEKSLKAAPKIPVVLDPKAAPVKPGLKPSLKPSGLARKAASTAREKFMAAPTRDNLANLL